MSDPRMISAGEARESLAGIKNGPQRRAAGTEQIVDLLETIIAQAAQIDRAREVLAWVEQAENREYDDWTRTADTHHRDSALAYTQAATWLRYALGDTDE